jgi:hypothetical protein
MYSTRREEWMKAMRDLSHLIPFDDRRPPEQVPACIGFLSKASGLRWDCGAGLAS